MVTWSNILMWRASELDRAGMELKTNRANVLNASIQLNGASGAIASDGDTVRKMKSWFSHRVGELAKVEASLTYAIEATSTAQEGVECCKQDAEACEQTASVQELVIEGGAGNVSVSPGRLARIEAYLPNFPELYMAESMEAERQRSALEQRTHAVLDDARRVDTGYSASLSSVEAGDIEPSMSASGPINASMTPKEAAAAWGALSQDEKDRLIAEDPDLIMGLDGIDGASRDKAARLSLDNQIRMARERLDNSAAHDALLTAQEHERNGNPYQAGLAYQRFEELAAEEFGSIEKYNDAVRHRDSVTKFKDELNSRSDTSLLYYALDKDGIEIDRAIVATGDIDNAAYINTFVPGMNTDIDENFFGYVDANENLRNVAAANHGIDKSDIATITYLDYEPPTTLELAGDVADPTARAREGAGNLTNFLEGVSASRAYNATNPEPHMTLMGHSYGSTTAGMAATQVDNDVVDDLAMFGSPGAGASDIREYNLDSGTAHVSAVPSRDVIQGIGGGIAQGADILSATIDDIKIETDTTGRHPKYNVDISGASDYADEFGINPSDMDGINKLSDDASLTVTGGTENKPGLLERAIDFVNPISSHGAYLPNPNNPDQFTWDGEQQGKQNDLRGTVRSPIIDDLAGVVVDKDRK